MSIQNNNGSNDGNVNASNSEVSQNSKSSTESRRETVERIKRNLRASEQSRKARLQFFCFLLENWKSLAFGGTGLCAILSVLIYFWLNRMEK
ncbi:hypothetical protein ACQ4LE_008954 [Meloidogyne hapla]